MLRHSHLAVVQQHAVHLLDGTVRCVLSFKMHKGVAFRSVLVAHHLLNRHGMRQPQESDYRESFLLQLIYTASLL